MSKTITSSKSCYGKGVVGDRMCTICHGHGHVTKKTGGKLLKSWEENAY